MIKTADKNPNAAHREMMISNQVNTLLNPISQSGGKKENPSMDIIKPSNETVIGIVKEENKYVKFPDFSAATISSSLSVIDVNKTAAELTMSVNMPANN